MTEIQISTLDGATFGALVSLPPRGHGAGLILIRGLFAGDEEIQQLADYYASLGYITLCPNLFHRQKNNALNSSLFDPDWEQALKLYKNFDVEAGVRDLLAAAAHVRKMSACGGKVGTVGFCLGCRMAYLLSARCDIDCAVGYYGVGLDALLDEVYDIRAPSLYHFGENDKLLPAAARQKILDKMARNQAITTYSYVGAEHGFARKAGATYHEQQAALANQRTEDFLRTHLQG